ncbi:hypothetical protein IWW48_003263 [Coemansia sp. RSA 1200]|nr:hypothetical protein IWW48_003263 [Coemansia sp. RSA 1200]
MSSNPTANMWNPLSRNFLLPGELTSQQPKLYSKPALASFDLRKYLEGYKGTTKIRRAMYVGEHCTVLAQDSYLIALDELESTTYNAKLHTEVSKRLEQFGVALPDKGEWKKDVEQRSQRENLELKKEIARTRTGNLISECQKAHMDLANLYAKTGSTEEAFRVLQSAREFCGDANSHGELQISAVRISQATFRWMQINTFAQRAISAMTTRHQQSDGTDVWIEGSVIQIQANFGDAKWQDAIKELNKLNIGEVATSEVFGVGNTTAKDFAIYATLSALMALGRKEVREKYINNFGYSKFFEVMPECLELLKGFYNSNYSEMLVLLDSVLSFCVLDPVIGPHVSQIKARVIDNIVVIYATPYMAVSLERMAKDLHIQSADTLESIVAKLITNKRIAARIDVVSGYLYRHKVDPRDATLKHIEKMYKSFDNQVDLVKAHIMFLEEESLRSTGSKA